MDAQQQYDVIVAYLNEQPPTSRLSLTIKLYYAYFLTIDEIQRLYTLFRDDFVHPDSSVLHQATLDWYSTYGERPFDSFDEMVEIPRPFIWDYDVLKTEFAPLLAKLPSLWVTYEGIDYSHGKSIGDSPMFVIEWLEERGLIRVDGMLLSRTIQPILINEMPSEKIVLAMNDITTKEFTDTFKITPAVGGGCAFEAIYGTAHLNINYADALGIDDVDSVMLCVGRLTREGDEVSVEELPAPPYYNIKRTLRNGLEVPFVN